MFFPECSDLRICSISGLRRKFPKLPLKLVPTFPIKYINKCSLWAQASFIYIYIYTHQCKRWTSTCHLHYTRWRGHFRNLVTAFACRSEEELSSSPFARGFAKVFYVQCEESLWFLGVGMSSNTGVREQVCQTDSTDSGTREPKFSHFLARCY